MVQSIIRRDMNREFRVKVNHGSMSMLVGWAGLSRLVGVHVAFLLVERALVTRTDKWTWKSRKGLRVTFYAK